MQQIRGGEETRAEHVGLEDLGIWKGWCLRDLGPEPSGWGWNRDISVCVCMFWGLWMWVAAKRELAICLQRGGACLSWTTFFFGVPCVIQFSRKDSLPPAMTPRKSSSEPVLRSCAGFLSSCGACRQSNYCHSLQLQNKGADLRIRAADNQDFCLQQGRGIHWRQWGK